MLFDFAELLGSWGPNPTIRICSTGVPKALQIAIAEIFCTDYGVPKKIAQVSPIHSDSYYFDDQVFFNFRETPIDPWPKSSSH